MDEMALIALWDVNEAARRLHVSPWTIRRWEFDGKLRAVRLGKLVRFEPSEIQRFIAEGRKPSEDGSSK
jgi:excisionase family DNA binding protein